MQGPDVIGVVYDSVDGASWGSQSPGVFLGILLGSDLRSLGRFVLRMDGGGEFLRAGESEWIIEVD